MITNNKTIVNKMKHELSDFQVLRIVFKHKKCALMTSKIPLLAQNLIISILLCYLGNNLIHLTGNCPCHLGL